MGKGEIGEEEVYGFIRDQIDTIPHLEALLLLWSTRPRRWPAEKLAERLFLAPEAVREILQDLEQRLLIAADESTGTYRCEPPSERMERLMQALASVHARELIRVTMTIHSKPSSAVREFARAFKFKKERE